MPEKGVAPLPRPLLPTRGHFLLSISFTSNCMHAPTRTPTSRPDCGKLRYSPPHFVFCDNALPASFPRRSSQRQRA